MVYLSMYIFCINFWMDPPCLLSPPSSIVVIGEHYLKPQSLIFNVGGG